MTSPYEVPTCQEVPEDPSAGMERVGNCLGGIIPLMLIFMAGLYIQNPEVHEKQVVPACVVLSCAILGWVLPGQKTRKGFGEGFFASLVVCIVLGLVLIMALS